VSAKNGRRVLEEADVAGFCGRFKEALLGLFFLVFFALVIVFSKDIKVLIISSVDAKFWPRIVGIFGCIVSLVHLIQGLISGMDGRKAQAAEGVEITVASSSPEGKMTLGLIFLFVLGINIIGFLPMAIIYLFLQLAVLKPKEERNYVKIAAVAVIFSTIVWAAFRYGFNMMLPSGVLWRLF
jgi:uncharacterized membrane protein